ncbi:MAG TPA: hypothetical protein VM370_03765 [Candidatus Thermoplasmatota archaeon]|nr:hypothetical protein [Candidatus Thermoplasmatota archaeon]
MRATHVAILAACIVVAALPVSLHAADARPGALADPSLRKGAGDGSQTMEWRGSSLLSLAGLCLADDGGCWGSEDAEDGRFFLPTTGSGGHVEVWWVPANESLRELRVEVAGHALEGESPLVFEILGANAGEYAVHASTVRFLAGAYKQPIQWSASFHVDGAARSLERAGAASYRTTTGCALVLCDDDERLEQRSDPLVVPWSAHGTLHVAWEGGQELVLSLPGTGYTARGTSPLTIELGSLPAGEWHLRVAPPLGAAPLSAANVRWSARLEMG